MTLLFLALALAMDSFAAAAGQGAAAGPGDVPRLAIKIAFIFGVIQALMPLLGWALGSAFGAYLHAADHWIAWTLLCAIGGKMIHDSRAPSQAHVHRASFAALIGTACGTSVDAAVAGLTFDATGISITGALITIGLVTALVSALGVAVGGSLSRNHGANAKAFGGLALVGIGTKILLEHLLAAI